MSRPMRGFLGLVLLLVVALLVAALVVVPMMVRPIVVDAVRDATPFGDAPLEVEVDANPVTLLLGSIDRIRITGVDLQAEGADIAGLDVTITGVSTSTHEFRGLSGRLQGVSLPFVTASALVIDSVELTGSSGDVEAIARLDLRAALGQAGQR